MRTIQSRVLRQCRTATCQSSQRVPKGAHCLWRACTENAMLGCCCATGTDLKHCPLTCLVQLSSNEIAHADASIRNMRQHACKALTNSWHRKIPMHSSHGTSTVRQWPRTTHCRHRTCGAPALDCVQMRVCTADSALSCCLEDDAYSKSKRSTAQDLHGRVPQARIKLLFSPHWSLFKPMRRQLRHQLIQDSSMLACCAAHAGCIIANNQGHDCADGEH